MALSSTSMWNSFCTPQHPVPCKCEQTPTWPPTVAARVENVSCLVMLVGSLCAVVEDCHPHIMGPGGRRRDSTQSADCPRAVPAGSSSCRSLLPICDSYSSNLVLIDLPQWTSRCSAQGRVGECLRKRDVRREQASEVPFTFVDLLPICILFYGQLQMLLSSPLIPCWFKLGKLESDLNGHLHEEKVFC